MKRLCSDPISIELPEAQVVVILRRSDDHYYNRAHLNSLKIDLNQWDGITTDLTTADFRLPLVYAVLTTLTGPHGHFYDSGKGSFDFPFKMGIHRNNQEFRYMFRITNYADRAEPKLFRIRKEEEKPISFPSSCKPIDNELGQNEIVSLFERIRSFLQEYSKTMPRWTEPFLKIVPDHGFLFGYDPRTGQFFEENFSTENKFKEACNAWREVIPEESGLEFLDANW